MNFTLVGLDKPKFMALISCVSVGLWARDTGGEDARGDWWAWRVDLER